MTWIPPPAASASDPSHSPAFAANCRRSSPAWRASFPDHSTENREQEEFNVTSAKQKNTAHLNTNSTELGCLQCLRGSQLWVSGLWGPAAGPGSQLCAPSLPVPQPGETRSYAALNEAWIRQKTFIYTCYPQVHSQKFSSNVLTGFFVTDVWVHLQNRKRHSYNE